MNLYDLHTKPEVLTGYQSQDLLPWNVYDQALGGERLTPVQLAAIAADPEWAYYYARDVVRGCWSPGEAAIAQDPRWAYWYTLNVVQGPWSRGEAAMHRDPGIWRAYQGWLRARRTR